MSRSRSRATLKSAPVQQNNQHGKTSAGAIKPAEVFSFLKKGLQIYVLFCIVGNCYSVILTIPEIRKHHKHRKGVVADGRRGTPGGASGSCGALARERHRQRGSGEAPRSLRLGTRSASCASGCPRAARPAAEARTRCAEGAERRGSIRSADFGNVRARQHPHDGAWR